MFLSVHATVGAVLGRAIPDPTIAFLLGFLSHFFIDMIPHGDEEFGEDLLNGQNKKFIFAFVLDLIFLTVLMWWWTKREFFSLAAGIGAFGAIAPDALQGVHYLFPRIGMFRWYQHVHKQLHEFFGYKNISLTTGIVVQACTLTVLLVGFF